MKTTAAVLLALIHTSAATLSLTSDNWDVEIAGKTVFIKYFAPWCGYCQSIKDDFDKLAKAFDGQNDKLIAEVDCDGDGSDLCDAHGIEGYPTIKYGDPSSLEEYELETEFREMKEFASSNLKPVCSPNNIDLCDGEKRATIEKFQSMDIAELKKKIATLEKEMKDASEKLEATQTRIEEEYQQLEEDKEDKVLAIKESGLMTMKMVYAAMLEDSEEDIKEEL